MATTPWLTAVNAKTLHATNDFDGSEVWRIGVGAASKRTTTAQLFGYLRGQANTWLAQQRFDAGIAFSTDLFVLREAANTIALRNGNSTQLFRLYHTYTDPSNYERFAVRFNAGTNSWDIGTQAAGTGNFRDVRITGTNGTFIIEGSSIQMDASRQLRWATPTITYLYPPGGSSNILQMGLSQAGPIAQTFCGPSARGGTDVNTGGGDFTIRSGLGTGTGTLASLILQSPALGSSGSAQQAAVTGLRIRAGTAVFSSYTVSGLPSASVAGSGARAFVTDANAPTFGSNVSGGGAVRVPVYSDGTNWVVG